MVSTPLVPTQRLASTSSHPARDPESTREDLGPTDAPGLASNSPPPSAPPQPSPTFTELLFGDGEDETSSLTLPSPLATVLEETPEEVISAENPITEAGGFEFSPNEEEDVSAGEVVIPPVRASTTTTTRNPDTEIVDVDADSSADLPTPISEPPRRWSNILRRRSATATTTPAPSSTENESEPSEEEGSDEDFDDEGTAGTRDWSDVEAASGRHLGPRGEVTEFVAESPQIARTYRSLLLDLLGHEYPSRVTGDTSDDTVSEPGDEDNEFADALLALEELRPRPASRGSAGRSGSNEPIPRSLDELLNGPSVRRDWGTIPRGVMSEWFPNRPPRGHRRECLACRTHMWNEELALRERHTAYERYAERNDRAFESALGLVSPLDWGDQRLRLFHPVANHSCNLGRLTSLPPVLFTVHGRRLRLRNSPPSAVGLRLLLHITAPGLPISWTSQFPFSGVFPLFGDLRRYWGRAVAIVGTIYLQGYTASCRRAPLAHHHLTLRVCPRRRDVALRHGPLEVIVTASFGPRGDIGVIGASLQWISANVRPGGRRRLVEPRVVSREDLRRLLRQRSHPHTSLRSTPDGWAVNRRERPSESLLGPIPDLPTATSGTQVPLGHGGYAMTPPATSRSTANTGRATTTSTPSPLVPHRSRTQRRRRHQSPSSDSEAHSRRRTSS